MIGWGVFIGFISYLPLANINLGLLYLSAAGERRKAFCLWIVAITCEGIYCYATLAFMGFLVANPTGSTALSIGIIAVFIALGIWNFNQSPKAVQAEQGHLRKAYFAAIIHPQQIPFWLIWGGFLTTLGHTFQSSQNLTLFTASNMLGAAISLGLYAVLGYKLKTWVVSHQILLSRIVGVLCFAFALYEGLKVLDVIG